MKLIDSVRIRQTSPQNGCLEGFFLERDGTVRFCYEDRHCVVVQNPDGSQETWYTPQEGEELPWVGRWTGARAGYPPMVELREGHRTEETYYYGGYAISHKSQWSYVCRRDGKEVWNFRCHSWRHTDIFEWNDRIYFGTAGGGGYLYILDLHSGTPLLALKTGATACIPHRENRIYVFQQEKQKTFLVCVNLNDGAILDRVELPGSHNEGCMMQLIGNTIHAVTLFWNQDRTFSHGCWNRIEI